MDLARARADTPGCEHVLHFNNAGAGLMPAAVLDTMKGHLDLEAAIGGYEAANRERQRCEAVYESLAKLLGCSSGEIAVVENATRAWDMAFYSVPLSPGDRILTHRAEYVSNFLAMLQVARRTGAVIELIPDDSSGQLDTEALRRMLDERVRIVAVTHVPTHGGLVNPVAEVGRLVRGSNAIYLVDACQSAGQMPLDVEAIGCDLLSGTGRKFLRGPRGVGFLYVRRSMLERLEPPFVDLHAATWVERDRYEWRADARRFENWESSYAAKLGLGAAVDYALDFGLEAIQTRAWSLAAELRERLAALDGVAVHDKGMVRGAIVTFTVANRLPFELKARLLERQVNVTIASLESARLDMEPRGLTHMVRASPHYYNTIDEVERFVTIIGELR